MRKSVNSMYYIWRLIVLTFLLLFILAACSTTSASVPTPSETPTAVPTFIPTPIPTPIRLGEYELLSPEDMRSDLDELFHQIETTHPNPYTRRSKAEVDLERQKIYDELGKPMTMFDFYSKVTPLVDSLGDQHTQIIPPDDMFGLIAESELFFPLEVEFDGQQGFITINYSDNADIPLGAEVLSINGKALSGIQSDLEFRALDGFIFWFGLWALDGSVPEYQVEILPPGDTTSVTFDIPGMNFTAMMQNAPLSQPSQPVTYTKIPDEPVGILAINTFIGIGPLLKPAFVQIQEDSIGHLIIDVRTNPGGRDIGTIMDYLTNQPYRLCSRLYKAPFGGYGSGDPRETECVQIQPFDTIERFQGELYLLVGPDSFSAAIMFANILQDYGLATLIGEETTDSASFCASAVQSLLPRTKLSYRFSVECYVRPNGVLDNLPVIPDILVETTIEDQISNRDPVLEYTLELIRSDQTP